MADGNDTPKNSGEQDRPKGIISEVANNLGPVYRHLLPGVLIVGTARLVRPCWFAGFNPYSWSFLAVVAVIAIALGNASFVVNRYIIHQVVDWLCWLAKIPGPTRIKGTPYRTALATHVSGALWNSKVPERARQHISFRASSVLLIYLLAELVFAVSAFHRVGAIDITYYRRLLCYAGSALLFAAGIWQNVLTRQIDAEVIGRQPGTVR